VPADNLSGLVIGVIEHLQNVATNNYDSLTELHTPKIAITTAHIKSSHLPSRCSVVASNGGRSSYSGFASSLWPQLPASHSTSSQRLNRSFPLIQCTSLTDWTLDLSCLKQVGTYREEKTVPLLGSRVGMPTWSLFSHCLAAVVVHSHYLGTAVL
jgi:hypothetical protein